MDDASLYLFGTSACHLCKKAEVLLDEVLEDAPDCVKKVDVSETEALMAQYGERIPVLGGKDMQGQWHELDWPFNVQQFLDFLDKLEA